MKPPGMILETDFLSPDEERELLALIPPTEKRLHKHDRNRVIRWGVFAKPEGIEANRNRGYARPDVVIEPMSAPLTSLALRVQSLWQETTHWQGVVIVNEYLQGQRIGQHTDHKTRGPEVCVVSVGEPAEMVMVRSQGRFPSDKYRFEVPPRSVLLMRGEARWEWTHGTRPLLQGKRYSFTFPTF